MTSRKVITLDDLNTEAPTLRLRSTANRLAEKKPQNGQKLPKITEWFVQMANNPNRHLKLRDSTDETAKQYNKQKINELFDKMKQKLDDQRNGVLKTMDGMTASQQSQLVDFCTEVYDFMFNVFCQRYLR